MRGRPSADVVDLFGEVRDIEIAPTSDTKQESPKVLGPCDVSDAKSFGRNISDTLYQIIECESLRQFLRVDFGDMMTCSFSSVLK